MECTELIRSCWAVRCFQLPKRISSRSLLDPMHFPFTPKRQKFRPSVNQNIVFRSRQSDGLSEMPTNRNHQVNADFATSNASLTKRVTKVRSIATGDVEVATLSQGAEKSIDLVTLGNLCVDIVKHVNELPPTDKPQRRAYMDALVAHPPPEKQWEGGGNCNTAIAAARLGLRCTALGHIGGDVFGDFLCRVLEAEGVGFQEVQEDGFILGGEDYDGETLLCWVIIHPTDGHTFCSRFDFNKGPAFRNFTEVPPGFGALVRRSRAVFCNGFVYDELPPPTVHAALRKARENGAAVFFDPGPRGEAFCRSSPYKRDCVETLMRLSDVLLMTAEEAETITGLEDLEAAAEALLCRGDAIQWVVIKDGSRGCHMAMREGSFWLPAYRVDVADTVGCGDSFAAAVVLGFIRGEGPVTTLALANAVGAATAMGVGAGRNVAQPDVLYSILADASRHKGTVCVRLKTRDEASVCSEGERRNGASLDKERFRGESLESVSTSNCRERSDRKSGDEGGNLASVSENALASEVTSVSSKRVSAQEEIRHLQSLDGSSNIVDDMYTLDFSVAAQAAGQLLRRSKSANLVEEVL